MRIVVAAECTAGRATSHSLEAATAARQLAGAGGTVIAVGVGGQLSDELAADLTAHGVNQVILVEHELFDRYPTDGAVHVLASLAAELEPDAILLPHSMVGAELAPRLAFRLNGAVVTGCTALQVVDDVIHLTRACFGGAMRQVVTARASPIVATLAAKAFTPVAQASRLDSSVERRAAFIDNARLRTHVIAKTAPKTGAATLESAGIVVAGGRGVGGPEGFTMLSQLADEIGGAVGASRVACDLGWCPPSWQVGLSGRTVAPDVYFAVGISGAPQHLAGCANARVIVAVNTDPKAEIFKFARFGVVADCSDFTPALVDEVRRLRAVATP